MKKVLLCFSLLLAFAALLLVFNPGPLQAEDEGEFDAAKLSRLVDGSILAWIPRQGDWSVDSVTGKATLRVPSGWELLRNSAQLQSPDFEVPTEFFLRGCEAKQEIVGTFSGSSTHNHTARTSIHNYPTTRIDSGETTTTFFMAADIATP